MTQPHSHSLIDERCLLLIYDSSQYIVGVAEHYRVVLLLHLQRMMHYIAYESEIIDIGAHQLIGVVTLCQRYAVIQQRSYGIVKVGRE